MAFYFVIIIVIVILFLSGCAAKGKEIRMPDGRIVNCILYYGKGISCDWNHTR